VVLVDIVKVLSSFRIRYSINRAPIVLLDRRLKVTLLELGQVLPVVALFNPSIRRTTRLSRGV
jgi:hypothetical protein